MFSDEGIVVCLIVFCIFLLVLIGIADSDKKDKFMAACLKDHKQYECDVLYGQSKGSGGDAAMYGALGFAVGSSMAGRR